MFNLCTYICRWATTTAIGCCWTWIRWRDTAIRVYLISKRGAWGSTNIWTTNNFWFPWTGKPSRTHMPHPPPPIKRDSRCPQQSQRRLRRNLLQKTRKCNFLVILTANFNKKINYKCWKISPLTACLPWLCMLSFPCSWEPRNKYIYSSCTRPCIKKKMLKFKYSEMWSHSPGVSIRLYS